MSTSRGCPSLRRTKRNILVVLGQKRVLCHTLSLQAKACSITAWGQDRSFTDYVPALRANGIGFYNSKLLVLLLLVGKVKSTSTENEGDNF